MNSGFRGYLEVFGSLFKRRRVLEDASVLEENVKSFVGFDVSLIEAL